MKQTLAFVRLKMPSNNTIALSRNNDLWCSVIPSQSNIIRCLVIDTQSFNETSGGNVMTEEHQFDGYSFTIKHMRVGQETVKRVSD